MQIEKQAYTLSLTTDTPGLALTPTGQEHPLLHLSWPWLLVPEFAEEEWQPGAVTATIASRPGLPDSVLTLQAESPTAALTNTLYLLDDRLICEASYRSFADQAVRHWHVAPPGSSLDAEVLHAYMGQPKQVTNGREFDPADAQITTAGHNYAYAISGPRLIARRGDVSACLGGTALANDFGLNCRLQDRTLEHLRFNYGGDLPLHLPAHTHHQGPRLQIIFTKTDDWDAIHGEFVQAMYDDGIIHGNRYSPEDAAFLRPIYCTWGDQVIKARTIEAGKNWQGQKLSNQVLDEAFVRRAVARIKEHELPIGTIVIDAGWQDKRGDWNLNTEKFPDLRGLVEELHADDFKVVMWWAPLQIEEGAQILKRTGMTAGPNQHGDRFFNYECPDTRAYIADIVQRFFSSSPDGWNIDGLKLDWMVEKVYPQPPPHDLQWRGEERCINAIYRMIHDLASQHKRSFCIWGGAGENPHLAPYSHLRGMEERFDTELDYIARHARMLQALRPGVRFKNHLCYQKERCVEAAERIKAAGGIPEIGLVFPEHVSPETMAQLRQVLL